MKKPVLTIVFATSYLLIPTQSQALSFDLPSMVAGICCMLSGCSSYKAGDVLICTTYSMPNLYEKAGFDLLDFERIASKDARSLRFLLENIRNDATCFKVLGILSLATGLYLLYKSFYISAQSKLTQDEIENLSRAVAFLEAEENKTKATSKMSDIITENSLKET